MAYELLRRVHGKPHLSILVCDDIKKILDVIEQLSPQDSRMFVRTTCYTNQSPMQIAFDDPETMKRALKEERVVIVYVSPEERLFFSDEPQTSGVEANESWDFDLFMRTTILSIANTEEKPTLV